MSYNYNIEKDIKQLNYKIKRLTEVKPYLCKQKRKIVALKILDLTKELKKISKNNKDK